MATLTIDNNAPDYLFWGDLRGSDSGDPALITTRTSTTFKFFLTNVDVPDEDDFAGWTMTATGNGFSYLANETDGTLEPTAGLISSIVIRDASDNVILTINNFPASQRMELVELYFTMFNTTSNASGGIFDLFTQLLAFNDIINGSEGSDDIGSGRNWGNDIINANGGNDFVKGDAGSDQINGGSGYDTLSYMETFYDLSSFRGINLNVSTGIVKDSWGGTDTFTGFEEYEGSRFRDVLIGSDTDREQFMGLRGADVINGGGGIRDQVRYDRDAQFGGDRGIRVNLDNGTGTNGNIQGIIRDGFGQNDTVINIERVIGTMKNDVFVGSAEDNAFAGMGGKDSFDGKGGFDNLNFAWNDWNGGQTGIVVNLAKLVGQIINDGFGNIENAVSMEGIWGTKFSDNIQGNDFDNYLEGAGGADTLRGRGGADIFGWWNSDHFGDTILDFISGEDELSFDANADIAGLTSASFFFNSGTSATAGAGASFYFNSANRTLFYDQDGTGGAFTGVAVVTIQAGGTIAASDIFIWI